MLERFRNELIDDQSAVRCAILLSLQRHHNAPLARANLRVTVERLDQLEFRVDTNLADFAGVTPEAAHGIAQRACFALANRTMCIADMRAFNALSSFREDECPILRVNLEFLSQRVGLDPADIARRLNRVLVLQGLPDFGEAIRTNRFIPAQFLKAIQDPSCQEFRTWLRQQTAPGAAEVAAVTKSFRRTLGAFLHTPFGKVAKLLLGLPVGAGPLAGAADSALDTFVFERLFPDGGPTLFLNRKLPTIFRSQANPDA